MLETNVALPSKPRAIKEEDFSGVFEIDGLYPGYGHTLGNSLRRIILSSLPGAAITQVKLNGVQHEFSTIEGVKEDVVTILLNLKRIRLSMHGDAPVVLALKVSGPKQVTAADISAPSQVTILSPEQHIADLTAKGASIDMEITVERGRGYVPADSHSHYKQAIDVLPIDAVFMPIRKVSYNVEPTRVGESTDFDKLTIELWSNGSMDATEAISQAARQIIEHLLPIAELSGKPMVPAATQPQQQDGKHSSISIEELELSVRAYNCLKRANINSLGELLKLSYDDLMNIKNFGKKSADEVIERLRQFGLTLADTPKDK